MMMVMLVLVLVMMIMWPISNNIMVQLMLTPTDPALPLVVALQGVPSGGQQRRARFRGAYDGACALANGTRDGSTTMMTMTRILMMMTLTTTDLDPCDRGREYLLAANNDARAFVVHMAGLVHSLRAQHRMAPHQRHVLALEALQVT
jgi:hypothetical protein